jgi:hypothetical protein
MEEKGKKTVGVENGQWGKRELSRLIFGQRGSMR